MSTAPGAGESISWKWSYFLLGALYALPAVAVTPFSPVIGLAFAVGVMPVAAFNLPGVRRGRRVILLIGALSGAAFVVGSLLTQVPWVGVVGIFLLALGAAVWARRSRIGTLVLALCVPLVGIGLSIPSLETAGLLGLSIIGGSVYAFGVAMLWPERQVPPPPRQPTAKRADTLLYGTLLGLAGATAAAIGYALHLEHVGWPTGSALLVMRPVRTQLILRSIGRATSVLAGALAAMTFALLEPSTALLAVAVGLTIAAMAATQTSRWYIAPAFTSFIVLTLLMQASDAPPGFRFLERVLETLLGVGVALFFGAVVPALIRVYRRHKTPDTFRTHQEEIP